MQKKTFNISRSCWKPLSNNHLCSRPCNNQVAYILSHIIQTRKATGDITYMEQSIAQCSILVSDYPICPIVSFSLVCYNKIICFCMDCYAGGGRNGSCF